MRSTTHHVDPQHLRHGRLTHDGDWTRCTLFDLNFIPDPMSDKKLTNGFYDLTRRLYSDGCANERRQRFIAMFREHRKIA